MIPSDTLINALRSLNFYHKRQADRVHIWKQHGTTRRVEVRRNSFHDEQYARIVLHQAGMPPGEIEAFILSANNCRH